MSSRIRVAYPELVTWYPVVVVRVTPDRARGKVRNDSHAELVYAPSTIDRGLFRVNPGEADLSLLFLKLQVKVEGADLGSLAQAMPLTTDPLTDDELEAVRLWIREGASADQVTPKIEDAHVPCPPFGNQKCFAYADNELAQDAQSHHSIIDAYFIRTDPNDEAWGSWTCLGGEKSGASCDPTQDDFCGERSRCATEVWTGFTCNRYPNAPELFGGAGGCVTGARTQFAGAQESRLVSDLVEGVYQVMPVKGFIARNSHAFNLTKKDTTIEQWVNVRLSFPSERKWPAQTIFDTRNIFAMNPVAPFTKKEICMTFEVPRFSRLYYLSSHMHQRGKLFRIWNPPNAACLGRRRMRGSG